MVGASLEQIVDADDAHIDELAGDAPRRDPRERGWRPFGAS